MRILLLATTLACAACIDLGEDDLYLPEFDTGGVGGAVTLADVQPLFTQSCALAGCHGGAAPAVGLSLEEGQTMDSLLGADRSGIPSTYATCAGADRLTPGFPDESCLWILVDQGLMPVGNPLPQQPRDLIRAWIEGGALEQ